MDEKADDLTRRCGKRTGLGSKEKNEGEIKAKHITA